MNTKKYISWKKVLLISGILLVAVLLLSYTTSYAISDKKLIKILVNNKSLFQKNNIIASAFRYLGWLVTIVLVEFSAAASRLYDTCFGFIDFTKYKEVKTFINDWEEVWVALFCLSILLMGILFCVGWEKKPKVVINLLLAVTILTGSTWVMNKMNTFISSDVRNEILGGDEASVSVYEIVGANVHDLIYLDKMVGLKNLNKKKNSKKVYDEFTANQYYLLDICETVKPEDVKEKSKDIVSYYVDTKFNKSGDMKYVKKELYSGVAWTDLLNEYYYRYTVDWWPMWLELVSIMIIYIFMSYTVIRTIYEIVVHRILAVLYSANINNNQKILKILDSLKDSYIMLLMTTVIIKVYLLACKFITEWGITGLTKGMILLFISFAVINGPNLIQKLTGADIGGSDGMSKIMSMFYGSQMVAGAAHAAYGAIHAGATGIGRGAEAIRNGIGRGSTRNNNTFTEGNSTNSSPEVFNQSDARANTEQFNNQDSDIQSNADNNHLNNENNNQNNSQNINATQMDNANINESINANNDMPVTSEQMSSSENVATNSMNSSVDNENYSSSNTINGESSALSSEQGKASGGYHMDNIGKGLQSKSDALNGINTGSGTVNNIDNSLKTMEKDIATTLGTNSNSNITSEMPNSPIQAGGQIFRDHSNTVINSSPESFSNSQPLNKGETSRVIFGENGKDEKS